MNLLMKTWHDLSGSLGKLWGRLAVRPSRRRSLHRVQMHLEALEDKALLSVSATLYSIAWDGPGEVAMKKQGDWWGDDRLTDRGDRPTAFGSGTPAWIDTNGDGRANPNDGEVWDPVAFIRNSTPNLTATFRVDPSSVENIEVRATSVDGGNALVFEGSGLVNTSFVSLNLSTTDTVGRAMDNRNVKLTWSVSINGGDWETVGASTHRLFVTYAAPLETATNSPTAVRVWYAMYYGGYGKYTKMDIAAAIAKDAQSRFSTRFFYTGEAAWNVYYTKGDCGSDSWLMHNALAVIGIPSEVRYVFPLSNRTGVYFLDGSWSHSQRRGSQRLIYIDFKGGGNNYEGTTYVTDGSDARYFLGGEGGKYRTSPTSVLRAVAASLKWI